MSSESNSTNCTINDTLYVTVNEQVSSGGKGDILVDDGVNVIEKTVGSDTQVLTYDNSQPGNLVYKPYLNPSNILMVAQGCIIGSSGNVTIYSMFGLDAQNVTTTAGFYLTPYDCQVTSIEMIKLPYNGANYSWPTFASNAYYELRFGYVVGALFNQFGPSSNPNFTIGSATVPIVGVTHYNRAGLFNIVRYVPPTPWSVTAGTKITLRMDRIIGTYTTDIYLTMIYYKVTN